MVQTEVGAVKTKLFAEREKYRLTGDPRDIMVPADCKKDVVLWCRQMGIDLEIPMNRDNQDIVERYFGVNLWRVRDEQQRIMFVLRWA